ncbi:agamous-like MADS-box protein AGL30 [Hibiscus syriacus]|uniref:agamous-like MADS-box protein AGL30 n=1 Tax=Hibiscus syriacus TaxID=106335 RepID=UPI001923EA88|nr:agamous-like MADS-box protein AGL30 [Hibiscus syriacus]
MGRRKLKILRLESIKARQATYSKRKTGIVKKAKEISILCDVDVALLLFSPTDKPTLFVGREKGLSDVLERLSKSPYEEREERREYTMQILKKIYANSESEFQQNSSSQNASENAQKVHEDQLRELKGKLAEKSKILRDWKDPSKVEDMAQIKAMEEHLISSLNGIRNKKSQLAMVEQQARERGLEVGFSIIFLLQTIYWSNGKSLNPLSKVIDLNPRDYE